MNREKRTVGERIRIWALTQLRPFTVEACAQGANANPKTTRNRLCELAQTGALRQVDGGDNVSYIPVRGELGTYAWRAKPEIATAIVEVIRANPDKHRLYIAKRVGVSRQTVSLYLRALVRCGYVRHEERYSVTSKQGPIVLGDLRQYHGEET